MRYFAYGTTQQGFPHHRGRLGAPLRRGRLDGYAIVVPRAAACSNPGCRLVHRMAALVPWPGARAEGDVFAVEDMAELDALELSGPYVRAAVTLDDGNEAFAYPAQDPAAWRELVARGRADALRAYTLDLATDARLKPCCERDPGHPPPHDVLDPFVERDAAR
jgi:gamma-glutamylcyclotransferase (GGCT)/AIG2-like uncharacterized protein YtfP